MRIVVVFDEKNKYYEIKEKDLNPKQIELILHMLNISKEAE